MIAYGAHAFVWIGDWTTETGNYAIAEAAKTGFDFIEIPILRPSEFDAVSHKEALEKHGIEATFSLVLPKDSHMPEQPQKAKEFLFLALDKVAQTGSGYLGGCIAYSLGTLTGKAPTQSERDTVIETLKEVADYAKERNIKLALEACNRYETYLYNSLDDTAETIKNVAKSNLFLHADTYHMNIEEEGFYSALVNNAELLDYIHMSESHRGLVGTGTVNWSEVWQGLADANFTGKLVLESFAAINPDLAAATCLWRPPNEGSEVLSKKGLAFLKEGAEKYKLGA